MSVRNVCFVKRSIHEGVMRSSIYETCTTHSEQRVLTHVSQWSPVEDNPHRISTVPQHKRTVRKSASSCMPTGTHSFYRLIFKWDVDGYRKLQGWLNGRFSKSIHFIPNDVIFVDILRLANITLNAVRRFAKRRLVFVYWFVVVATIFSLLLVWLFVFDRK